MRDSYLKRAPNMAYRVLGGEAIVMDPSDSSLYSLNETATVIWQAADGTRTLREIVENDVCEQFDVEPEEALREAETFLAGLAGHGVLLVSNEAGGAR